MFVYIRVYTNKPVLNRRKRCRRCKDLIKIIISSKLALSSDGARCIYTYFHWKCEKNNDPKFAHSNLRPIIFALSSIHISQRGILLVVLFVIVHTWKCGCTRERLLPKCFIILVICVCAYSNAIVKKMCGYEGE